MPEAEIVLRELKERGYALAILSNAATPRYTQLGRAWCHAVPQCHGVGILLMHTKRHVLQHSGLRKVLDPALCYCPYNYIACLWPAVFVLLSTCKYSSGCFSFQLGLVKPDARIFDSICEAAGIPKSAALMVGDSLRTTSRLNLEPWSCPQL